MGKRASKDLKRLKCSAHLLEGIVFWKTYLSIIFIGKNIILSSALVSENDLF